MQNLPPIPILTIVPPKINEQSYQYFKLRSHINMLNGQPEFSNSKDEVDGKYKHLFDKNEKEATQSQGSKEMSINITLYKLCKRCDRWILKDEEQLHLSCHAAIVLDNLFLGDKFCSQSRKQLLQRIKITHVVNAASELANCFQKEIKYIKLQLMDNMTEDLIPQIIRASEFIKKAHDQNGKVFVHCAMGKSRSVSVILIYLMNYHNMTLQQSLQHVKSVRPVAMPNPNYMNQLKQYSKTIQTFNKSKNTC